MKDMTGIHISDRIMLTLIVVGAILTIVLNTDRSVKTDCMGVMMEVGTPEPDGARRDDELRKAPTRSLTVKPNRQSRPRYRRHRSSG